MRGFLFSRAPSQAGHLLETATRARAEGTVGFPVGLGELGACSLGGDKLPQLRVFPRGEGGHGTWEPWSQRAGGQEAEGDESEVAQEAAGEEAENDSAGWSHYVRASGGSAGAGQVRPRSRFHLVMGATGLSRGDLEAT